MTECPDVFFFGYENLHKTAPFLRGTDCSHGLVSAGYSPDNEEAVSCSRSKEGVLRHVEQEIKGQEFQCHNEDRSVQGQHLGKKTQGKIRTGSVTYRKRSKIEKHGD